ncbi:MAG: hypothetical protein OXD42_14310 [Rhodospirillaceae bacterium]|nr:hypothetical protein [Rhodospirillaceae bacterium]
MPFFKYDHLTGIIRGQRPLDAKQHAHEPDCSDPQAGMPARFVFVVLA